MGNKQDFSAERQSLKDKLMAIILLETSKDYKKMDSDLVKECVDFLMELEGKERLTKAEIEQRVNAIPFKGKVTAIGSYAKRKLRAKRLAVIAAILAVLLALFGIIAVSSGRDSSELLRRLGYSFIEMFGGEIAEYSNITLIKPNETKKYNSIEELLTDEKIEILYPTWLPENEKIVTVMYLDVEQSEVYVFKSNYDKYGVSVTINGMINDDIKADCFIREINGYTAYCFNEEEYSQAIFEYRNNLYNIKSDTEDNLFKTIESLSEIN